MADSENQQPVDSSQQMTSNDSTTTPRNPKRVTVGKAVAQKTKQARGAQKKALAEAQIVIANNQLKQAAPPVVESPVDDTTQWLSVFSIFISHYSCFYNLQVRQRECPFIRTTKISDSETTICTELRRSSCLALP